MFSSQVFESALSITMFVLRILVPLLSTVVLVRCFVSLKRGRRKEEPVVLLEVASGLLFLFYIGKILLAEAKAATLFYLTVPAAEITLFYTGDPAVGLLQTPIPKQVHM